MKLAFVVPWYGKDTTGGAENECRRTSEHLHSAGLEVEVLTTCVRDFRSDWSIDHYRPGVEKINGITVRRFPASPRNATRFDYVNLKLMHGLPISREEEEWYIGDCMRSKEMEDFIRGYQEDYTFVFIPYMFGTTYWGSQICPERSFLVPCLHNEIYAHLAIYRPMFQRVNGLLFHTRSEMELAQRLYGVREESSFLVGVGIDTELRGDGKAFREKYGIEGPFLLHVGRRDAGKNVELMLSYFQGYSQRHPGRWKLVLIGAGELPLGLLSSDGVLDLGFLPRQEVLDAYAAATLFCQPSVNESFALVIMEAWLCGTPALVHADCMVTVEHCLSSQGGLYFANYAEFEACLDWLLENPALGEKMAALGREYVRRNFHWERVVAQYKRALLG